jgi:hypothetical protein
MATPVDWPLSNNQPTLEDVRQGDVGNCALAGILAALAFTSSGRGRLNDLITEYSGLSVTTTLSRKVIELLTKNLDAVEDKKPQSPIKSSRYFTVNLDKPYDVSDVFYAQYQDRGDPKLVYMGRFKEAGDGTAEYYASQTHALWPSVIEKAFASSFGGYENMDATNHPAEVYWRITVGKPTVPRKVDDLDAKKISDLLVNAPQIPTIGATREIPKNGSTPKHGIAILGLAANKVSLYDPILGRKTLRVSQFIEDFEFILQGRP